VTATLTGAWLAMKLGIEPRVLDVRRRAGELLAVPAEDGADYLYPAWQFDNAGRPLPVVARVVAAGREAGLDDRALYELLLRRDGMTGEGRLLDSLRAGREDRVLEAIRAASSRA
jgi:hypothetical protein